MDLELIINNQKKLNLFKTIKPEEVVGILKQFFDDHVNESNKHWNDVFDLPDGTETGSALDIKYFNLKESLDINYIELKYFYFDKFVIFVNAGYATISFNREYDTPAEQIFFIKFEDFYNKYMKHLGE